MPGELHNTLAVMALRWLNAKVTGRGLRGGFEVSVADGYVADAVGLCTFQLRFAEQYVGKKQLDGVDAWTVRVPEIVAIFESKASRQDFLATFGSGDRHANRLTPVGNLHWCVCARGIAKPEELPEGWGMLQVRGSGLTELRPPNFYHQSQATLHKLAYRVLWYAKNNHQRFARAVYDKMDH